MGVPDLYSITVEGAKNFRAAIESEERASWSWMGKWGWILDEYKAINRELAQLKEGRKVEEEVPTVEDKRTTRPFSETEGHEYGFLASKPEFRLEIFSTPGLTALPHKLPPKLFYKLLDEKMEEKMKKHFLFGMNAILLDAVKRDRAFKEYLVAEERAVWNWHKKWGWLIDEYKKIYKDLQALSKHRRIDVIDFTLEGDDRTMRPFPDTTGHEYGHLIAKPEFVLEKFSSSGLTPLKKSLPQSELYVALDKRMTKKVGGSKRPDVLYYYKKTLKPKEEHNMKKVMTML